MYQKFELFLVEQVGSVLDVRINRPESRNAITFAMEGELAELLKIAADDDSVRVVAPQGEGKVFSVGHDLKEVASGFAKDGHPAGVDRRKAPQLRDLWYFPRPIVAGMHGYAGPIAQGGIPPSRPSNGTSCGAWCRSANSAASRELGPRRSRSCHRLVSGHGADEDRACFQAVIDQRWRKALKFRCNGSGELVTSLTLASQSGHRSQAAGDLGGSYPTTDPIQLNV
jgi:hypothetical protein